MSGKQAKKERKARREAERRAAAKAERQRTLFTIIVVVVVLAIGGVVSYLSIENEQDPLAELQDEQDSEGEDSSAEGDAEEDNGGGGADDDAAGAEEAGTGGDDVAACDPEPPPETVGEEKPTFERPEQVLDPARHDRAVIETSCGDITLDLDHERAPQAVNSFVFLAEKDFFDGLAIFRNATSIGALQTGAGDNSAQWNIGYTLEDELTAAEEDGYPPGAVAMANSGPDSSGSQFFFVYNEKFQVDPTYTRFAKVTEGMDVLRSVGAIPVEGETPTKDVYIEEVRFPQGG